MHSAILRTATKDDVPAITALMADLHEWFASDVPEIVRGACSRCPGLVAIEESDKLAGFVLWQFTGDECRIEWLGVTREQHRHGIGRLLISRLGEIAREKGAARLLVDTVADTVDYEPYARSRAFYEACGFRLQTVEPGGHPDGTDKATYALTL